MSVCRENPPNEDKSKTSHYCTRHCIIVLLYIYIYNFLGFSWQIMFFFLPRQTCSAALQLSLKITNGNALLQRGVLYISSKSALLTNEL